MTWPLLPAANPGAGLVMTGRSRSGPVGAGWGLSGQGREQKLV